MSTRHVDRPYVRQRRVNRDRAALHAGSSAGPAARLATLAGLDANAARPSIERLEPRQMLFSLTITPDLVGANGIGTLSAVFGYAIPQLQTTSEVETNDPESRLENFDGEALGGIGSGRVFAEQALVVFHTISNPASNFRMIADLDGEGQPVEGTERIFTRTRNGEAYRFRFLADENQPANGTRIAATDFEVSFGASAGSNQGITPSALTVVLRLAGDVVRTFDSTAEIQGAKIAGNANDGVGTYRFTTGDPEFPAFDEIEFVATAGNTPAYTIDNVSYTVPAGNFVQIITGRIFGAAISFTGPVGSSVTILDLYGRDMRRTIELGTLQDVQIALVDQDDNGVPNFNDGIGKIIFSGTDSRSSFRIWGGGIEEGNDPTAFFQEGDFQFNLVDELEGLNNAFEAAGFGFFGRFDDGATGLPPVGGSVIIGSPLVRPIATYNPGGQPVGPGSVNPLSPDSSINPDHGVFILDGSSFGQLTLHASLFGSSRFEGAVESINVSTLFGSITVEGDLGNLWVQSDAGLWQLDPDFPNLPPESTRKTGGQLIVGRTLGNVSIGARSALDITVVGDTSNPQQRPPLDQYIHLERELLLPVDENAQFTEADFIESIFNGIAFNGERPSPIVFGTDLFRNDLLAYAEWIGNLGTGVQVLGRIGIGDPGVNTEDPSDVFAFPTDGTAPVVLEFDAGPNTADVLLRVVDQDGNTLAANNLSSASERNQRVVFNPRGPGVYYVAIMIAGQTDGDTDNGAAYSLVVSGIAPTVFGNYFSGAGTGAVVEDGANTINVLAGNLGAFRPGMGLLSAGGQEYDPTGITNTTNTAEFVMALGAMSLSVADGNLYALIAGSDVEGGDLSGLTTIFVDGDLGMFVTGQAPVLGFSSEIGDVGLTSLEVGGRVGTIDIRGSIGDDVDAGSTTQYLFGLNFRSGSNGGSGDVGLFRVGDDIWGPTSRFQVSPGSVVGAFLVSQDNGGGDGIYGGVPISGFFTTGVGSDVRFVDIPNIDLIGGVNSGIIIRGGVPVEVVDDAGATVRITVTGGANGVPVGFLRFIPIDGSEGVALARIDNLDLTGRSLLIETLGTATDGRVSIGRLNIIGADAGTNVTITGNIELDIWQVSQLGGEAFGEFINNTPNGDIVAMDMVAITRLELATGSLGRTELPAFGPNRLAPNLGIAAGQVGEVGGALGITRNAIDPLWNGNLYRPLNSVVTAGATAYLDDLGGPFDAFLDGLVVRTGSVNIIRVGGAVGDIILQGGTGAVLNDLAVNTDNFTPIGAFHGIFGSIYASNINRIVLGDGLRGDTDSPLTSGSIFADNQIVDVSAGTAARPAGISGRIWAANVANTVLPAGTPAIGRVNVLGGDYVLASIGAGLIDGFWASIYYNDDVNYTGNIDRVTGQNADFFRSSIAAQTINTFTLVNGFFDASNFNAQINAGTITAQGYRNSTLTGTNLEFTPSLILIGSDLGSLQTQTLTGDIRDTIVDVVGSITTGITAGFVTRSQINVDNRIPTLTIADSIRGSKFVFGRLELANITDSIRHSEFRGNQILSIVAGDSITNSAFTVSGPDGRIDTVSALNTISGAFTASGPIGSISTTLGDIDAAINTTTRRGTVGTLSAGRDLILESDISRGIASLIAGRHVGSLADPSVVRLRGNLTTLTAPNGQLYSDIRVGQDITGLVTLGRAVARPANNLVGSGSLIAFGRIASVAITGDFGGSIISYTGGIGSVTISDGSFLRGSTSSPNTIAAYDGDITSLVITNGNLYGDVYADYNLVSLQVLAGADGVFGDVGVNPAFTASQPYDAFRNRLPVGVAPSSAVQGPRIAAGRSIVNIAVSGGSVFESSFYAGRAIQTITIAGDVASDSATTGYSSWFAAGDTITSLTIGGSIRNAVVSAGVLDGGSDNLPGGLSNASDIVQAGSVAAVSVAADASNVLVLAGIQPGADGLYNTGDDRAALGLSTIGTVNIAGAASSVILRSDIVATSTKPGVVVNGGALKTEDDLSAKNNPAGSEFTGSFNFNLGSGERGTFTFSGPGRAFWNNSTKTLSLVNTTLASSLSVQATGSTLTLSNLNIVTNDDASLGALTITGTLAGNSNIVIDGDGSSFTADALNTSGRLRYGGNLTTIRVNADFRAGHLEAKTAGTVSIGGSFGDANTALRNEASISLTNATSVDIDGSDRGVIVVAREINLINVDGAVSSALVRVGSRLGQFLAGSLSRTRISVGDFLGGTDASSGNTGGNQAIQAVRINGSMFDSAIMVGGDLGSDGEIGGTRLDADRVSTGFLGSVFIGGNFEESDIVAGLLRGTDGFFGTSDDAVAAGRATTGSITIIGNRVGSNRFTESYRIASTGTLGAVTIGGVAGQNQLNFAINALDFQPVAIQVQDVTVSYINSQFVATLVFNQAVDAATLDAALSVRDIRSNGNVQVFLISGEDYTLGYNPVLNAATVTFSRSVTEANLPITAGRPALGTYNFVLDFDVLRGSLSSARLDGDSDGFARGEDFIGSNFIGDAGDKLSTGSASVVVAGQVVHTVDFYAPASLDIVMDSQAARDGLPDINSPFTIRGFIGDHADHNSDHFRFAGDTDLYAITLQAGQILRLGSMGGSAQQATRSLLSSSGQVIYQQDRSLAGRWTGGGSAQATRLLSADDVDAFAATIDGDFYIRQSGVYYIAVGSPDAVTNTGTILNTPSIPNGLGAYSFTVEVFDDLDSGFASDTDSGDGTAIVNAPPASAFTSPGQTIVQGDYTFSLSTDPLGNPIVVGANSLGVQSINAAGVLTSNISSSIGPGNLAGVPNQIFSDIDIYHLNNRAGITPGSIVRITLKVSEVGGDLGSKSLDNTFVPIDHRARVQLGVFDTTTANSATNGSLYFSPSDFNSNGGTPNTTIADNGSTSYGYDANGDFFIQFVAAGRPGADAQTGTADDTPASYAVYVQGVFNTDYQIQVVTSGSGSLVKNTQNFFIETLGGEIAWLETGGLITQLEGYDLRALGFTGNASTGVPVNDFVLQRIVANLEDAFDQLGLSVNFSTDSSEFEFQPFSTIFLTTSVDPVNLTFNTEFGYSEHSDSLNADLEDEAVVFLSSFSSLQFTPDDSGLTALSDALTAAVGRRAGELLGLRVTTDTPNTGNTFDLMAANSPDRLFYPGNSASWSYLSALRNLSTNEDSDLDNDFFIGAQSSASLLERVLLRN